VSIYRPLSTRLPTLCISPSRLMSGMGVNRSYDRYGGGGYGGSDRYGGGGYGSSDRYGGYGGFNSERFGGTRDRYGEAYMGGDSVPNTPLPKIERKFIVEYTEHPEVTKMTQKEADQWRKENDITLIGSGFPNPILDFSYGPFPPTVISYLNKNYQTPTPIQSQSWPVLFSGKDMVGSAKTGSGKTIAFVLPALEHIRLQRTRNSSNGPVALILAPTRELVQQIHEEVVKFQHIYSIHSACFFGGQGNRSGQLRQIYSNPQIVIAAPGRLMDFVNNGVISLSQVSYFVLDEADRMLDMGFEPQIRSVVDKLLCFLLHGQNQCKYFVKII